MEKFFKQAYLFFIIIFSGLAIKFFHSNEGIITLFVLAVAVAIIFRVSLSRNFIYVILIWAAYCVALYFIHGRFTPLFLIRHVSYFLTAYVLLDLFKLELFYYIERIILYLSVIGLFFYAIMVLHPGLMVKIGETFDISQGVYVSKGVYYNFLVYTADIEPNIWFQRNCGFCWEPGPYAIYLVLAFTINLLRNNFKIKGNRTFYVLIISLITTKSTTGFLLFGTLAFYFLYTEISTVKKYYILAVFSILFIIMFFNVPFLYKKISTLYVSGANIEQTLYRHAQKTGESYSSGRFGGLVLAYRDFSRYPFSGIGGNSELSVGNTGFRHIFIVNGLGNIISIYGLFGITFYLYLLFKSSRRLSEELNSKTKYAFFLVVIIGSFSFSVHNQVIIYTVLFFCMFYKTDKDQLTNKQLIEVK